MKQSEIRILLRVLLLFVVIYLTIYLFVPGVEVGMRTYNMGNIFHAMKEIDWEVQEDKRIPKHKNYREYQKHRHELLLENVNKTFKTYNIVNPGGPLYDGENADLPVGQVWKNGKIIKK